MYNIYNQIIKNKKNKKKQLCWLIDPDKINFNNISIILSKINSNNIDFIFFGTSLLTTDSINKDIEELKKKTDIPIILFPGGTNQISENADAILLLSLISGRNPDLLIGKHVEVAYRLKKSNLQIIPTAYIIVNTGKQTSVSYMSNTTPIPFDKNDIAVSTAIAGELLGFKMLYVDAGSGAEKHVDLTMIKSIAQNVDIPLIVGGGIKSPKQAKSIFEAGADMIVLGTAIEKNTDLIYDFLD